MAEGAACIDNAPNTMSMAMSRTFPRRQREMALRGLYSHHMSHCIDDPPRHGTIYSTRQYVILPYDMCDTSFRESGNEASIRVPRMFK
jgi:hypothetical protein